MQLQGSGYALSAGSTVEQGINAQVLYSPKALPALCTRSTQRWYLKTPIGVSRLESNNAETYLQILLGSVSDMGMLS